MVITMKQKLLKSLVLSALIAGSSLWSAAPAMAAVQVNPIPGISSDLIKGVDISILPEMEKYGAKFYDTDGTEMDCLAIMQKHGVNWIRVRIWNDVSKNPGGGGDTDEKRAIELVKRAHALGMKALVDLHYSDWWADPGSQTIPAAWKGHSKEQIEQDIYDFTQKIVKDFRAAGCEPEMMQIGNEITNGMVWPLGKFPGNDDGATLAAFVKSGCKAVRDLDPEHKIELMIHLDGGDNNARARNFFDSLILKHGVDDFDAIGFSFYPFWSGYVSGLQNNINDVAKRYNKKVIVAETALGYSNKNFDDTPNHYGPAGEKIGGFLSSVQGQATGLRALMEAMTKVPNGMGQGIFYWEPEWYPVKGAGVSKDMGNQWDNVTLFDKTGKALESLDVFNLVDKQDAQVVKPEVVDVETPSLGRGVGQPVELPATVRVTFSDDHFEPVPVEWKETLPSYSTPGTYEVEGNIPSLKEFAIAEVTIAKNYNMFVNPGFEDGSIGGYTIVGDRGFSPIQKDGDMIGNYGMHFWFSNQFDTRVQQTFTHLKPGKYTARVKNAGGGGQSLYQLFIVGDGGQEITADMHDTGWNKWHTTEIRDIEIKEGGATVGIHMAGPKNLWGSIDDFEFFCQDD